MAILLLDMRRSWPIYVSACTILLIIQCSTPTPTLLAGHIPKLQTISSAAKGHWRLIPLGHDLSKIAELHEEQHRPHHLTTSSSSPHSSSERSMGTGANVMQTIAQMSLIPLAIVFGFAWWCRRTTQRANFMHCASESPELCFASITGVRKVNSISHASAQALKKILQKAETPQALELMTRDISLPGAEALCEALKGSTNLSSLSVATDAFIGAQSINPGATFLLQQALPEILTNNSSVKKLSLQQPFFSSETAAHLKTALENNIGIQDLTIDTDFVLKGTMKTLGQIMASAPQLKRLSFTVKSRGTLHEREFATFAALLRDNASLQELCLRIPEFSDQMSESLADAVTMNTALRVLELKFDNMSTFTAAPLVGILAKNNTLQALDFQGTPLNDSSVTKMVDALEQNASLQVLNIQQSLVSDDHAMRMASILENNDCLHELNLVDADITDRGAMAFAQSLRINSTLYSLDLRGNRISDSGCEALASMLSVNTSLQTLALGACCISDVGLKSLGDGLAWNSSLLTLKIGGTDLEDQGVQAIVEGLRRNTSLTSLTLQNYSWYTDKGKRAWGDEEPTPWLRVNRLVEKARKELETQQYESTTTSFQKERQLLQKIKQTSRRRRVRHGPDLVSPELKTLKAQKELLEADYTSNTRRFNTVRALPNVNFTVKNVVDQGPKALAEQLKENISLKHLEIRHYQISENSAVALAEMLQVNTTLLSLELQDCYISPSAAQIIAAGLAANRTLTHLNLRWNFVLDDGALAIAEALRVNSTLHTLDLRNNYISGDALTVLADCLASNHGLQSIDFRENCAPTTLFASKVIRQMLSESRLAMDEDD